MRLQRVALSTVLGNARASMAERATSTASHAFFVYRSNQEMAIEHNIPGEKLAESEEELLEHRTDGSDAFDTLYIGCEKFPFRDFSLFQ